MNLPFGYILEADFQGSFFLYFALVVVAISFIIFTNKRRFTIADNSPTKQYRFIFFLRIISIVLLLTLIFDPQISLGRNRLLPKKIAMVIDQSHSMTKTWQGSSNDLLHSISDITKNLRTRHDLDVWSMDGKVLDLESVKFSEDMSHFSWSPSLGNTGNSGNIYSAVFIVSDGHLNRGSSPLDLPWTLSSPVYPLYPLKARSNRLLKISAMEYKFDDKSNNTGQIKIKTQQEGLSGRMVTLSISDEAGQVIGDRTFRLNHIFSEESIPLQLPSTQSHRITISLSLLEGDLQTEKALYVESVKSVKNLLLVSEHVNELHKFLLLNFPDSLYQVFPILGTNAESNFSGSIPSPKDGFDLIVINQPGNSVFSAEIKTLINSEQNAYTPIVLFLDGSSRLGSQWADLLKIQQAKSINPTGESTIYWGENAKKHPLYLSLRGQGFAPDELVKYPPIYQDVYNIKTQGTALLVSGSLSKPIAALTVSDHPPVAVFSGRNYWKWFFHPQSKGSFQKLWDNMLVYLEDIARFKPVNLDIPVTSAATGEHVGIAILVKDINNATIRTAELRVWQEDKAGNQDFLNLKQSADGTYTASLIAKTAGAKTIIAEAYRFGELWGRDTSRIELLTFNEEDQSEGVNEAFLARIAKRSGGQVIDANKDELPLIPEEKYSSKSHYKFKGIRSSWIFLTLLVLLIVEWALRRRNGLL